MSRKNCSRCKRWRQVCTDFSPVQWVDKEKTTVKKLMSVCKACVRKYQRETQGKDKLTKRRLNTRRATWRVRERAKRREAGIPERKNGPYKRTNGREDSVPREPFAAWIREKINSGVMMVELSERTGVPERLLRAYLRGYDKAGVRTKAAKVKPGHKRRAIDWVSFTTVDEALARYGEGYRLNELYPLEDGA